MPRSTFSQSNYVAIKLCRNQTMSQSNYVAVKLCRGETMSRIFYTQSLLTTSTIFQSVLSLQGFLVRDIDQIDD
jgi:hypothetical protein